MTIEIRENYLVPENGFKYFAFIGGKLGFGNSEIEAVEDVMEEV